MKVLILFILILATQVLHASISIISDLDDTIKITKASGNPFDLIGKEVYTGMPEFLTEAKSYTNSLYILSASPSFMEKLIKKALLKHQIEYKQLILRSDIQEETFKYKLRKIIEIFESNSDDFILIGDDYSKDPEVYGEIKRLYPGRVLEIYIHSVNGREDNVEAIRYWTSFDLSLREFLQGRLSSEGVNNSIERLTNESKLNHIFPKNADCPKVSDVYDWQLQTVFQQEAKDITDKLLSICLQR